MTTVAVRVADLLSPKKIEDREGRERFRWINETVCRFLKEKKRETTAEKGWKA